MVNMGSKLESKFIREAMCIVPPNTLSMPCRKPCALTWCTEALESAKYVLGSEIEFSNVRFKGDDVAASQFMKVLTALGRGHCGSRGFCALSSTSCLHQRFGHHAICAGKCASPPSNDMKFSPFALVLLVAWATGCQFGRTPVDLVMRNGHVVCLDGAGTHAQALAIHEGDIVAVGKEHEILNAFRGEVVEDLKGATVYPGLIDAHSHLLGFALNLSHTNVVGTTSWDEVITLLEKDPAHSEDAWVRGRGWDQTIGTFPRFQTVPTLMTCFLTAW